MPGVAVLCWEENRPWVSALRQKGFSVPWVEQPKGDAYQQIPAVSPDVLVVDLTRLPEQGREMVIDLADRGELRGVPVILVSESANASKGLRSKLENLVVAPPTKVVSAVRTAMESRSTP